MFGRNQIEDVRWLCSLSETELDMLIWMKRMVLHRAEIIGHKSLAQEFDLRTLRSLSLTMMKHLMDHLRDLRVHPSYAEAMRGLGGSNLSRSHVNSDFSSMSPEELWAYICPEKKKRIAEMLAEDKAPRQKRKNTDGESSEQT
ncbi:OLC1v1033812C7 [Oldenlandia corymbosa var. corymbosa]|uniref:OLC1v1033812C7 n=1 Tax=Oldenlandia corymbosa var. corymbosa TaxID=529605 RepID=A0AAV1CS01_OLDCO|nr:OLC1v1033812C7 [Oldenlandia corymbosa var. corymbosa]